MPGVYYPIPNPFHVIGLAGKAGSGKNYLARHALLPLGFFPIALADHFKVDAVVRDGAPLDEVFFTAKSPETRDLLQKRGTEEGRWVHGEDIWIKTMESWIAAHVAKGWSRFVVTDVRFRNEADWVRALGGCVVQVTGRGGLEGAMAHHPSEVELDDYEFFDAAIDNRPASQRVGSPVEDLKQVARAYVARELATSTSR